MDQAFTLMTYNTVKVVYKAHPLGPTKHGPYTQVVFVYRFINHDNMESMPLQNCKMWSL